MKTLPDWVVQRPSFDVAKETIALWRTQLNSELERLNTEMSEINKAKTHFRSEKAKLTLAAEANPAYAEELERVSARLIELDDLQKERSERRDELDELRRNFDGPDRRYL